ncbi:ATP-dependent DNA helicase [Caligus rogercresseyi]|uniref:ATP-dependent DNA helicase n=1 Tax=Caligus rogercresseyi TaxID=217165 RepID=A0A7T8HH77_CALRO|nr:ATP-dependent DNA helicase [Caligus rogercresseyi]
MQQNYQDAMAIVAKYGNPDLFLTYTCNPKAQEITENLRDHERYEHRPDLVSIVYHLHLAQLQQDIKDRHVLGVPVA